MVLLLATLLVNLLIRKFLGQIAGIASDVRTMIKTHEAIAVDQTLIVNVDTFAASSIDFFIYCFIKPTNWIQFYSIKEQVLLEIQCMVAAHSAEIAFPTITIHLATEVDSVAKVRVVAQIKDESC